MRKLILLTGFFCYLSLNAQYVTIPDNNFRSYLIQQFPTCFNAQQQMDTTCTQLTTITSLTCGGANINDITGIKYFVNLTYLDCAYNHLSFLPDLPPLLSSLFCEDNLLTNLSSLPPMLTIFACNNNNLTSLPNLPNNLEQLVCTNNSLLTLPPLPNSLIHLYCSTNNLTSLPDLPMNLQHLQLSSNNITSLPPLPPFLRSLDCINNVSLSCLPFLPDSLRYLYTYNTGITCKPNFPPMLINNTPTILPICSNYSQVCLNQPMLKANVFFDANNNNSYDGNDNLMGNALLHNTLNNYHTVSSSNLGYIIPVDSGILNTIVITNPYPYSTNILPPSQSLSPTIGSGLITGNYDFAVQLIPNIQDLEVTMVNGIARPGFTHTVVVKAKNIGSVAMSNVSVSLNIPSNWVVSNAIPNVSSNLNNQITWNNLSLNVFEQTTLTISVTVPSTVPIGTPLAYSTNIFPTTSDINLYNNSFYSSDSVQGSYDPNDKTVSKPYLILPYDANDPLFYTLRFQNTGTDTAFNIVIRDSLDGNKLNINTLQVINSSHFCKAEFTAPNVINFHFPNILLQDSFANEPASHGFVQFSIQPQANLQYGEEILNNADIFFDYNAPIRTNTTRTKIIYPIANQEVTPPRPLFIYPNPTQNGKITIHYDTRLQGTSLVLYHSLGGKVAEIKLRENNQMDYQLSTLPKGVYFYQVLEKGNVVAKGKIVRADEE